MTKQKNQTRFFYEIKKKNENFLKCLSDSVNFHIIGHLFCPKLVSIPQIFEKFCNFLQISLFNFKKLGLFIKIFVYSNKKYAIVTILVNKFVT